MQRLRDVTVAFADTIRRFGDAHRVLSEAWLALDRAYAVHRRRAEKLYLRKHPENG